MADGAFLTTKAIPFFIEALMLYLTLTNDLRIGGFDHEVLNRHTNNIFKNGTRRTTWLR